MRNVAVTVGDKIEAQIQFCWTVDYYGIGDLVEAINQVTDQEVDALFAEYKELYDFDYGDYDVATWESHIKEQVKYENSLKRLLDAGGYTTFSDNFEALEGT